MEQDQMSNIESGDQMPQGQEKETPFPLLPARSLTPTIPLGSPTQLENATWAASQMYLQGKIGVDQLDDIERDSYSNSFNRYFHLFATDPFFLRTLRSRRFYLVSCVLHMISVLIVLVLLTPFPVNLIMAALGAFCSFQMTRLCIISVSRVMALFYGMMVALWWGFSLSYLGDLFFPVNGSVYFSIFGLSIGFMVHIWFVNVRLRN